MSKLRDPWLDNAKFWLVALVVVGHSLLIAPPGEFRGHVYDFIYQFHMPAFVLVSGYLSRSFAWTRRHLTALVTTMVVPYLVFEAAMALWRNHLGLVKSMDSLEPLWLQPHWPMWFLAVLLMWRLATPVLKAHWMWVPASVAISLVGGSWEVDVLDVSRFLGLMPFFVIGLHLRPVALTHLRRRWTPLLGLAAMGWLWTLAATTDDRWDTHQWFYYRSSYETLGVSFTHGVEMRFQVLLVGLLGTFAFLSLVPRTRSALTAMGAGSMVIYLFHGFVVQWAQAHAWRERLPEGELAGVWTVIVGALLLTLLLGWSPVRERLALLADPVSGVKRVRAAVATRAVARAATVPPAPEAAHSEGPTPD
ncbi:acyltransferase family protein [Nocardioides yefusunii]|uniref:Acyltransferase family protein n=1 Tax=Nocardioides yefusunii TaxID=2500546 RepID=A0ABW1QX24_9ACTN|nr:acyltransferase family protein [Nocardioides yefusunii]